MRHETEAHRPDAPLALHRRAPRAGSSVVLALAAVSAAAPVACWHIVGDAIDNGIVAGDTTSPHRDVVVYVAIGVVAWVLHGDVADARGGRPAAWCSSCGATSSTT